MTSRRHLFFTLCAFLWASTWLVQCSSKKESILCYNVSHCPSLLYRCIDGVCVQHGEGGGNKKTEGMNEKVTSEIVDVDAGPQPDQKGECESGFYRACYTGDPKTVNRGICKQGKQLCFKSKWDECLNQVLPQKEICDSRDNDCDGEIDEVCECKPGEQSSCYTGPPTTLGKGICKPGKRNCQTNRQWGPCSQQILPQQEVCDSLDNNCDGKVDEGCQKCSPGQKRACYTGPAHTRKQGECRDGTQVCSSLGTWANCQNQKLPDFELCNKKDDDCDGKVDDSCQRCKPGQTTQCYPLKTPGCVDAPGGKKCKGVCKAGKVYCIAPGQWDWSRCVGLVIPRPEQCNGKDDDCDGQVDEGLARPPCANQKGSCAGSGKSCVSGVWRACSATDYKQQNSTYQAGTETLCDGKDNNCNGQVDENCTGSCTPGQVRVCYSGPSYTRNKGICRDGKQTCLSTRKWGSCLGQVVPRSETCNGQDDDCDTFVDEAYPEQGKQCKTGKPGLCDTGFYACQGGKLSCPPMYQPRVEICNGKDDNCNGQIDDGAQLTTFYRDFDGDGYGDPKSPKKACLAPAGYVSNSDDCYDKNNRAFPGQLAFFLHNRGDGSFDYNCDGIQSKRFTKVGSCNGCQSPVIDIGFLLPNPACGTRGKWVDKCRFDVGKCYPVTILKTQECR